MSSSHSTTSSSSSAPSSSSRPLTPEAANEFKAPTENFLCPLSANTYGIDFLAFKIRDVDGRRTIFEVSKDPDAPLPQFPDDFDTDQLRSISYKFPASFLDLKTVGTTLTFKVGDNEVKDFRMIERHYFQSKLIKSYDFNFMFCIPNTTNTWEAIYEMPKLTEEQKQEMIDSETGAESDSFYFVSGKLVMHNKARYRYIRDDSPEKTSD